jgi:hypothetical protein
VRALAAIQSGALKATGVTCALKIWRRKEDPITDQMIWFPRSEITLLESQPARRRAVRGRQPDSKSRSSPRAAASRPLQHSPNVYRAPKCRSRRLDQLRNEPDGAWRQVGTYADRILKGTESADLPSCSRRSSSSPSMRRPRRWSLSHCRRHCSTGDEARPRARLRLRAGEHEVRSRVTTRPVRLI